MKKSMIYLMLIIITAFGLQSCSEEVAEAKNMEQIYKEEGVPVKIKTVKKDFFEKDLTFNAVLTGKIETSSYASIDERIEKVNVKVGDYVQKDQILVTFPIDNPAAQYHQAKVAFENSEATYNRYKNLFETGGISKQDLDNVKTQYEVSNANWDAVKTMIKVKAPISGYVTKVAVRESENVKKEALLFTIGDLSKLKAKVNISETEIDDIKVGDKATAVWNGKEVTGKVIEIDLAMNPRTQSFTSVLEFDNSEKEVKAGVTANITIISKSDSETITIERKNTFVENDKNYIYKLNGDKAEKSEVKLGKSKGLYIEILEGLNDNEKLIVEGQLLLSNNSKVKVIK
ncbi:MAG: efflux RND transporter periplasmic adaptor subunit [Melioribacteraceae bacterium]|nr:efflux RND transporter periplasmic adaptor subunit [Melioribacteraceae bacterium]